MVSYRSNDVFLAMSAKAGRDRMALFDISLPPSIAKALNLPGKSPERQQLRVLKKLLKKARFTEFGQQYHFDEMLLSKKQWKEFCDALDAPPKTIPALRRLLTKPGLFDANR